MNGQKMTKLVVWGILTSIFLISCSAPPASPSSPNISTDKATLAPPTQEPTVTIKPTLMPTASATPTTEPTATIKPTITPLPFIEGTEFPIGTFEQVGGHWYIEFRIDGTGTWFSKRTGEDAEIVYGVTDNLYSEMKLSFPVGPQLPATYYWTYDGEFLIFQLWGKDLRAERKSYMIGQTYRLVEEAAPISITAMDEFPTGRFINENRLWTFNFNEDGTWSLFDTNLEEPVRSGKYATSGNWYTELTHDDLDLPQVPATYFWTYDGQKLSFELWGEDVIDQRMIKYDGQTYTKVDE